MKYLLTFFSFLFLSQVQISAQFGDQDKEARNLYLLSRTWGLFKYHHPDLKNCEHDWDEVLLRTLEKLDGAPQSSFSGIVGEMMDEAGSISDLSSANVSYEKDEELYNLEMRWFKTRALSFGVKNRISHLYDVAKPSGHCLLKDAGVGNLDFTEEKTYDVGEYPDKYYRILAMFRYWNIIDMFFPYKHILDKSWNLTFTQNILPITYAEDRFEYHLAFKKLTVLINDSHSGFGSATWRSWLPNNLRPFDIKYVEGKSVIRGVYKNPLQSPTSDKFEVGDIVLSINGEPMEDIRAYFRPYALGSNESVINREIDGLLSSSYYEEEVVEIEKSDGQIIQLKSNNTNPDNADGHKTGNDEPAWKTISTDCTEYGYIHMGKLREDQIPSMVDDLWSKEAIIFDVRNYPNGTLWPLHPYLFDARTPQAAFTTPNMSYPGTFRWINVSLGSSNNLPTYQGKLLILMNEQTQSQAEYTIMGLENHPGALKIGSQTSGADGNISYIYDLPGNISTIFTGLGTYYPDGTPTQRIGIVPDIEVHPTIEGLREGRDEVLEAAMDCSLLEGNYNSSNNTFFDLPQAKEITSSIYPNPIVAEDDLYISLDKGYQGALQFTLFDELGREIQTGTLGLSTSDYSYHLSTRGLTAGVYVISLQNEEIKTTQKFVVTSY